ncbi:hypothetical protein BH11BAC1_BH11BAC1_11280 [soil metagenome]
MKNIILYSLLLICCQSTFAQTNCMDIGVGLSGTAYWEAGENPFIDQLKLRGNWISYPISGGVWDSQHAQQFYYDNNGYPNCGIPFTDSSGSEKLRFSVSANGRLKQQQYVFLYDGYGEFNFNGFTVDSIALGRIKVTCISSGNVWIDIDSSSLAPNHARNFRLVPVANEFNYDQLLFRQSFLDKANNFYTFRFMDWFATNGNGQHIWTDRATPSYYSQSSEAKGVAYEYAIKLCNMTGKQSWINVPALADTNFIIQMATLFRDSLNSNLDIYLEYSNEVWNFQFSQTQWINNTNSWYPSNWPPNELFDSTKSFAYNAGLLANRTFTLWRSVFGTDSLRVKRVLACQAANSWVAGENIAACNHHYDYLSPAWYFGISPSNANSFTTSTTPEDIIDTCRYGFFTTYLANFKNHYTLAAADQRKVIHYEGGQHISAYGNGSNPALQAMYDAQIHPNMYTLYDNVLDSMRTWGSELAMAFVLGGDNSQYGSWGHIRSVDSISSMSYSPKFQALLDNLPYLIPGCNFTGISELLPTDSSISIFPNPFNDNVNILSRGNKLSKIFIYDIAGRILLQKEFTNSITLNTSSLADGVYIYELRNINGTSTKGKVVKQ